MNDARSTRVASDEDHDSADRSVDTLLGLCAPAWGPYCGTQCGPAWELVGTCYWKLVVVDLPHTSLKSASGRAGAEGLQVTAFA